MFQHGPSCLSGPVTRRRDWWFDDSSDVLVCYWPDSGVATMDPPAELSTDDRPVRADLVERVRREIAEGTYETPEKWEAALDRLLRRAEEGREI